MPTVTDILGSMDYGPSPEQNSHVKEWLSQHARGFGHYIGGAFVKSSGTKWIEVTNPANEEILGKVPHGTAQDVDAAVKAARKAFASWSKLSQAARRTSL